MEFCKRISWFLTLFTVITAHVTTESKRVLLLPHSHPSHISQLYIIGNSLANEGHEVYMGMAESFPKRELYTSSKVKLIIHEAKDGDFYSMSGERTTEFIMDIVKNNDFIQTLRKNHEVFLHACTNPLSDEKYYRVLRDMNFDLAIVDIYARSRCLLILPYSLGIPYIGATTFYEPWLSRTPAFPSVVPNNFLGNVYTDNMNFWERLGNLWQNIDWVAFTGVNFLSDENMQVYIRNKTVISLNEMTARCLLFLREEDPLLDYPRPSMPNELHIGGLTTGPTMPLSTDLQGYLDSAENGVILVSFGSTPFSLDHAFYTELKTAFSKIKQNIVWKHDEQDVDYISGNVKIIEWLPQNDILGHQNTRIFITHCGNNGQMEALYHGVPMLGIPLFADQYYNCKRIAVHGYGICLNHAELKAKHIVDAVQELLSNETYHKNIKHSSDIFKDRPFTPLEHAVFWINHVMKYGGQHIHSWALDMPWYQYLMLDIAAFILTMMTAIVMTVECLIKIIITKLCNSPHIKRTN